MFIVFSALLKLYHPNEKGKASTTVRGQRKTTQNEFRNKLDTIVQIVMLHCALNVLRFTLYKLWDKFYEIAFILKLTKNVGRNTNGWIYVLSNVQTHFMRNLNGLYLQRPAYK